MGACMSNRIKADIPFHTGVNSKNPSTKGRSSSNESCNSASALRRRRSEGDILQSTNLKSFTFGELKAATRNFQPDSVLGESGFGSVFKGWIDENSLTATKAGTGLVIAVKRINLDGFQGHKEWLVSIGFTFFKTSVT